MKIPIVRRVARGRQGHAGAERQHRPGDDAQPLEKALRFAENAANQFLNPPKPRVPLISILSFQRNLHSSSSVTKVMIMEEPRLPGVLRPRFLGGIRSRRKPPRPSGFSAGRTGLCSHKYGTDHAPIQSPVFSFHRTRGRGALSKITITTEIGEKAVVSDLREATAMPNAAVARGVSAVRRVSKTTKRTKQSVRAVITGRSRRGQYLMFAPAVIACDWYDEEKSAS